MKKFKFSMEAVRLLKNKIEEEAAQRHARALLQVGKAKGELAETERELNAAALMQFSAGKKTPAQELVQLNQYIATLEKLRRERLERCLHAEKDATLARAALEKAAREREILDRVHEHQHSTHKFHVARQEQKWMDEIAQKMKRGLLAAV
ncbi:MAG: flagellar export protein FliJ [Limisphaerales bacterium]